MKQNKKSILLARSVTWLTLSVLAGMSFGCASVNRVESAAKRPTGTILIKGGGATFPSLLYKQWFAAYRVQHPNTEVTYDVVGSGEGVRRFIGRNVKEAEAVDFGASDAAMTDDEIAAVPSGVLLVPATAGCVVLAYNIPEFEGELQLSRKAYSGIFLGEITNWNDPLIAETNKGLKLPNLAIAPIVRQDSSGTTYALTNHLDAISEKWHSRYGAATVLDWPGRTMRAPGNEGVAARVEHSVGSIGYVGLEFASKLGLKMALLENKEGNFVKPTEESSAAALSGTVLPENLRVFIPDPSGPNSYPIVTFSWILLYRHYGDAEKDKAIHELVRWCLEDGQKYSAQIGYVPLPSNVVTKALAALEKSNGEK